MRGRWLAGVLIGLFVVSGCSRDVAGRPVPVAGAAGSGATVEPTGTATAGACRPGDLMRCIVAAPAGSTAYSTPLGPDGAVTTQRFIDAFYPDDARYNNQIANQLRAQGLQSVAHRNWVGTDGDQVDIVLLGFASPGGARSRAMAVETSTRRDPTLTVFDGAGSSSGAGVPTGTSLPGGVVAFVDRTVDKYGNVGVRAYGAFGSVEMEFNYARPAKLDAEDLVAQVGQEVALLAG